MTSTRTPKPSHSSNEATSITSTQAANMLASLDVLRDAFDTLESGLYLIHSLIVTLQAIAKIGEGSLAGDLANFAFRNANGYFEGLENERDELDKKIQALKEVHHA